MFSGENIGSVCEVGGLVAATVSLFQAQKHHDATLTKAREQHREAINIAKEQHKKNLAEAKRHYLLELFNNLEQHFQQLNADLIASSKESERDMFDQRNQNFQTIILASSVMFTALSTAIIDGMIPYDAPNYFVVSYALTSSMSFAFLFLCVVVCIELVLRASSFMYCRAQNHAQSLRKAISKTKTMMEELRNRKQSVESKKEGAFVSDESSSSSSTAEDLSTSRKRTCEGLENNSSIMSEKPQLKRSIVSMGQDALDNVWRQHENDIQTYMQERENIHDACAVVEHSNDSNSSKKSFQQFWDESCKYWSELAILFFYAGTLNLLLSIMIFMWTQFFMEYKSVIAAIISVSLISLSLVIGISAIILLRIFSRQEQQISTIHANGSSENSSDSQENSPV